MLPGLSDWLKKNNYQNPVDDKNSLFKFSSGIDTTFFGWLFKPENKKRQEAFHKHVRRFLYLFSIYTYHRALSILSGLRNAWQ